MKGITPFLWFDQDAEAAMDFYTSIFKHSKIVRVSRYGDAGPGPKGQVMVGEFEINGQRFMALNGGPQFKFTEAISFVIHCEDQEEIDYYWSNLTSQGGQESQCGWLKDKFGLSWQVAPTAMAKMLKNPKSKGTERAFAAMMEMKKLDIAALEAAFKGKG